jgi:hypothetical protein
VVSRRRLQSTADEMRASPVPMGGIKSLLTRLSKVAAKQCFWVLTAMAIACCCLSASDARQIQFGDDLGADWNFNDDAASDEIQRRRR